MRPLVFLSFLLAATVIGCASTPTVTPPAPAAPTLSAAPSPAVHALSSSETPTVVAAATPVPTPLTEPAVVDRFSLLPLPGIGRAPSAIALLGDMLYVADRASDNVAVITDGSVRAFIPTPYGPDALAASPAQSRIYVGTYITPTISIIEGDALVKTAVLSDSVESLALAGDKLLAGLGSSATIEIRDPATLDKRGEVRLKEGFDVGRMVVDAARHRLYANPYGWVVVLDLDSMTEVASFEAPYSFGALAVDTKTGIIWAGIYDDKQSRGYLAAYDEAGKELRRVTVGADLRAAAVDSSGRIYVANSFKNQVDVVDGVTGQVAATMSVGLDPTSLLLDDANHLLYVGSESSDNISVLDTSTLKRVGLIPVGMDVKALLADQGRGRVYAANASTDSVFVIQGGLVVGEIPVGHHPVDLATDPKTNRLFVANYADGTLSVVDEISLTVSAVKPITDSLSTVAVDPIGNHLFADSAMFSLDTLKPEALYDLEGPGIFSPNYAEFVRVNPPLAKLYVLASNGIPGSNSRTIIYSLSEANMAVSKVLPYRNGGNITAMAIDTATQRVYGAATHPLAYTNALEVWDGEDKNLMELPLGSRTSGMVVNPVTSHLFLAHSSTYEPFPGLLENRDNAVQIIDTRTLGNVEWLDVPGGPAALALLDDTVYVAGNADGSITLIRDVSMHSAPPPTPTFTPSPYSTSTFTPRSTSALPTQTIQE
jgi:YVTN family beta-propeller protein